MMMNIKIKSRFAFTLIEMLVVLTMAAMVLAATLTIYQRVRGSAVTIVAHMERSQLQDEILQKIAEDIDRLAAPGFEATIKFRNKLGMDVVLEALKLYAAKEIIQIDLLPQY